MNIAMIHFRVGMLDGVSLEMDKWKMVLEKSNHNVIYLAGQLGQTDGFIIEELSLDWPPAILIKKNAFNKLEDFSSETELEGKIRSLVQEIKPKIEEFFDKYSIDFVIPNNIFCLPLNIPATIALYEVIRERSLPGINHNHDFVWERIDYQPTCELIKNYLTSYFPPKLKDNFKQVVINSIAQNELKRRLSIDSAVVPNVFYFEKEKWQVDDFNIDLRKRLNIKQNDIVFLQATRIVVRKGIELAIDLIAEFNKDENRVKLTEKPLYDGRKFSKDSSIVLVMPNLVEDSDYSNKLEHKMRDLNVEYRFCNDLFGHQRCEDDSKKTYSLWDSYVISDLVTYPSLIEGWGNQFLEAIKAKLPIVVFEYPVYRKDIGSLGFKTISLGSSIQQRDNDGLVKVSQEVIQKAAKETIEILQDGQKRKEIIEYNYQIGLEKLSLKALEKEYIIPLLSSMDEV